MISWDKKFEPWLKSAIEIVIKYLPTDAHGWAASNAATLDVNAETLFSTFSMVSCCSSRTCCWLVFCKKLNPPKTNDAAGSTIGDGT